MHRPPEASFVRFGSYLREDAREQDLFKTLPLTRPTAVPEEREVGRGTNSSVEDRYCK